MKAHGLSLWIVPEEAACARLRALIASLAERLGTPAFEPHVTLLGGLAESEAEVSARARELARLAGPLRVPVAGLGEREEFFRCLFLELRPDPPLTALHGSALGTFSREGGFLPHVSLVYGALDVAAKKRLRAELAGSLPAELRLDSLHVVRTEGAVADWRPVHAFPLSRPD